MLYKKKLVNKILKPGGVAEWLKAADCKSARVAYVGSNPTPTTIAAKTKAYLRWVTLASRHRFGLKSNGPQRRFMALAL